MNRREMLKATAGVAVAALVPTQITAAEPIVCDSIFRAIKVDDRIFVNFKHVEVMVTTLVSSKSKETITKIEFKKNTPIFVKESVWDIHNQNLDKKIFTGNVFVELHQFPNPDNIDLEKYFSENVKKFEQV